jgi:hypothetical protein
MAGLCHNVWFANPNRSPGDRAPSRVSLINAFISARFKQQMHRSSALEDWRCRGPDWRCCFLGRSGLRSAVEA